MRVAWAWLIVAVLVGGCLARPAAEAATEASWSPADSEPFHVALPADASYAILHQPAGAESEFSFSLDPPNPDTYVAVHIFRADEDVLRWRIGAVGFPGEGSFGFTLDRGEHVLLVHAVATEPTRLVVDGARAARLEAAPLSQGAALVSYHLSFAGAVQEHEVDRNERGTAQGPLEARLLELASEDDVGGAAWTFSAFSFVALSGAGTTRAEWRPFGEEHADTRPYAGPALGRVALSTQAGEGRSGMRASVDGAAAFSFLVFDHASVPLDPSAFGFVVEPMVGVGLRPPQVLAEAHASTVAFALPDAGAYSVNSTSRRAT